MSGQEARSTNVKSPSQASLIQESHKSETSANPSVGDVGGSVVRNTCTFPVYSIALLSSEIELDNSY
jgi:hypothetical protein